MDDFLIMRPFGPLFFTVFAVFLLILIVASRLLRNKSEKTKALVIAVSCWIALS